MVTKHLAFLFLLAWIPSGGCVQCPGGWVRYGDSCYVVVRDFVNWYEAKVLCATVNGTLIEIENADQNNFVLNMLKSHRVNYAWIGLEDLLVEGKFVWASDAREATYTKFHVGQPNDAGHLEDCVVMYTNGDWYDDHCRSSLHPAICQIRQDAGESEIVG